MTDKGQVVMGVIFQGRGIEFCAVAMSNQVEVKFKDFKVI